jgi:hypothetical protein
MLAGYLIQTLEWHSDKLVDALVKDLTTNERTPSYRRLQSEDLRDRAHAIYRHVVDWLAEGSEVRIAATFEALGRLRFDEQVPLEELVYAIILTKRHVRASVSRLNEIESAIELHYVIDLHAMIDLFFDRALHAAVTGYEQQRREPLRDTPREQWAKFGIKTSQGVKVSGHLGGWVA